MTSRPLSVGALDAAEADAFWNGRTFVLLMIAGAYLVPVFWQSVGIG